MAIKHIILFVCGNTTLIYYCEINAHGLEDSLFLEKNAHGLGLFYQIAWSFVEYVQHLYQAFR
jgi:hypothetical protein